MQVIGGDRQDRLIPVPYSKSSTDQAVSQPALMHLYYYSLLIVELLFFGLGSVHIPHSIIFIYI